jgi:predicted HTH domain antitoxin
LLGASRLEFDALLKKHDVAEHAYDIEDLEQDLETLAHLETSRRMPPS